jgi:hypothetical protein
MSSSRRKPVLSALRGMAMTLALGIGVVGTSHADEPWQPTLMDPALLAALIEEGERVPYILYVGPRALYDQGHIKGSIYIGPAAISEGMDRLVEAVKNFAGNADIVVYCGCCPWHTCPNLPPADRKLRAMGFTNVKMLDTPTNLSLDWINKNYPTSR